MGLTQTGTDGLKDDAVSLAKMASGTDGQVLTYDASGNPVAVGPGTDGQVLTSTGAGSPPAFEDATGGGATGGGTDKVFYNNDQSVDSDYTIPNGNNSMSAGPITIANGVTVTIGDGETWIIL